MNRLLAWLPLCGSLLLSACGPDAGDECNNGGYLCDSDTEALECRDGKWRVLPCKGPLGCTEEDASVHCDMSGNVGGDACALSAEGRGLCTASGTAVLECRMGFLEEVQQCSRCTMTETRVTCEP